ncbi:hypothetical protein EX30DRAFT_317159 [Ascodesmis nigricans]|uniref:Histone acetyltransferases subunit 3-domain-containing protein n=1 Tax=Ascodesmis nigricans TaxID=341454 RepID=A0A4S2N2B8_9PEZI|nr:hypothetical protein EX30DRAFT_317159 [Ascodesmis nigricans]
MSSKAAKKGKLAGSNSQRRSRSRNTTPASAFSADTSMSLDFAAPSRIIYEDLMDKFNISDSSSIPSSSALSSLKSDLQKLEQHAREKSKTYDQKLRELHNKIEAKRSENTRIDIDDRRRSAVEEDRKDKLLVKKKKRSESSSDNKRPPAVGAHMATGQSMLTDTVAQREKKKLKSGSPEIKRRDSSSPETARSDVDHQPPPAPPYVVFEPLDDDPGVYEIPAVTKDTSYEEKAQAFSVARFPHDDLSSLIPGDPPDEDLSKAKPTNQVAINTFAGYIEPYFRPYIEEDMAFLRERGDRDTPYLIPKLGRHYSEVWAEEDGGAHTVSASPAPPTNPHTNPLVNKPRGKPDDISDDILDREEISCGPLLSRLLSAYLPDDDPPPQSDPNAMDIDSPVPATTTETPTRAPIPSTALPGASDLNWKIPTQKSDYASLDERIRREMIYVGLLDPTSSSNAPDFDNTLDDEVSARLRTLQSQLREQSIMNGARKARIAEILKEHMAYQEYVTILDDLDKQVEQAYTKRSRNVKAQKKKKSVPNGVGVGVARVGIGEQARMLMERRRRWIETIGPVFEDGLQKLPERTVFKDLDDLVEREKNWAAEEE